MDEQRQDDQLEPTYSSSVPIQDVTLKTCWKQWTIGRGDERGFRISELMVRRDDDDDDDDVDGDRQTDCDSVCGPNIFLRKKNKLFVFSIRLF